MTILFYTIFTECLPEEIFSGKLKQLPLAQASKIRRFRCWEDAHASLFGKLLLLKGLKEFGISSALTDMKFNEYGKPYFENCPVSFNISHSSNCVVCVVSNDTQSIGIDIEEIKFIDINELKSVWNKEEWDRIRNSDIEMFYQFWTRKEAIIKAEGKGFSIDLTDIDVQHLFGRYGDKTYFFNGVSLDPDFITNIATLNSIPPPKIVDVPALEL